MPHWTGKLKVCSSYWRVPNSLCMGPSKVKDSPFRTLTSLPLRTTLMAYGSAASTPLYVDSVRLVAWAASHRATTARACPTDVQ